MPKVLPEYKDVVRSKITQAAFNVFSQKGYHDSKMDEIAKEAGLSKPTLYKYFNSKKDLLKSISASNQQLTEHLLHSFEGQNTRDILDEIYNMMVKSRGSLHLTFEITSLSSHDLDIQKLNRESYRVKIETLTKIIENQQNKGLFQKEIDSLLVAQLLTAIYTDIATQLIIGCDELKVREYWIRSVSTIIG
ncbi:MAG TPA: TetR/AcrR family transcriptional regulator [Methanobacteriaceae archaeon]|nr:TetR/AcrR family transcriptional regulator [Methanobacteriaceae archaeon]